MDWTRQIGTNGDETYVIKNKWNLILRRLKLNIIMVIMDWKSFTLCGTVYLYIYF